MKAERVTEEWAFGIVKIRCKFLNGPHSVAKQPFLRYVKCAFLLTNIYTCIVQSQIGLYYNCPAPELEVYSA